MDTLLFLQHYWWFLISLLGALLVFLLFVQGGQGLLYTMGRTEAERDLVVNALGRKWEFTFTTLVTFGGAFFASLPLFYSTSFGGANRPTYSANAPTRPFWYSTAWRGRCFWASPWARSSPVRSSPSTA